MSDVTASARAAYERNAWARHWYAKAQAASARVEWWRFMQLMLNALDGRFVRWFNRDEFARPEIGSFADFAYGQMKKRAEDKHEKRDKKLFDASPPSADVLSSVLG